MQLPQSLEIYLKRCRIRERSLRRPMLVAALATLLALVALAPVGCDQRAAPQPPAATEPAAVPTTQQLISGPRTNLALHTAPLRLSVPQSWKLDLTGTSTTLRGLTPHGSIQLTIAFRTILNRDKKQFLIEAFQAKGASQGYRRVKLSQSGSIDILDLQQPNGPIDMPLLDDQGKKLKDTSAPLTWKFLVFVPEISQPDEFDEYELAFFNLDDSHYQADKDLLESIMATLKYDPAAGDGS
jgi:uncharacterized membrane protein